MKLLWELLIKVLCAVTFGLSMYFDTASFKSLLCMGIGFVLMDTYAYIKNIEETD